MANGTIPADQQNVLLNIGEWLGKYGESIYGTRPWYTYGEGPTKEPEGNFKYHQEFLKLKYSANDIRFTTKGKNIYATVLGWPDKDLLIKSFAKDSLPLEMQIKDVSMLGYDQEIKWNLTDEGLFISVPSDTIDVMANVFKIKTL
jgi:alpha-L-fucosidase